MINSGIYRRRLLNFYMNRRAFISFCMLVVMVIISIFAPFLVNDKPLIVKFDGKLYFPVMKEYPETFYGGEFDTPADYHDPYVQELIINSGSEGSNGNSTDPEHGWIVWPLIPYASDTINYDAPYHPHPPSSDNWLGTDDQGRDVLARIVYGFRISLLFGVVVTLLSVVPGLIAGAMQGYFGGMIDIVCQRIVEIWSQIPSLYVLLIVSAMITPNLWILIILLSLFGWPLFAGIVRTEFLRARNFEYVLAAKALGVSDFTIMFRHILPNAMVATLVMLPFAMTGAISGLAALDFLGFGLPSSYPSLGELALQGKRNLYSPWLGISAFCVFSVMLSLLVFMFEGVRDMFDPRKVF